MWTRVKTTREWADCRSEYSFYHDLIGRYWAGGPSEAFGAPVHRICTLARKMDVSSVLIEDALQRADVVDEIAHLESWSLTAEGPVSACTISFLWSGPEPFGEITADDVIGQMTLITYPNDQRVRSYVFEALLRLPCMGETREELLNNNVPVAGPLDVVIDGSPFVITGAYFCQQNGVTSICAHSAVRSLIRTVARQPVTVRELNKLWNHRADCRSVTTAKLQEALRHFGLRSVPYRLENERKVDDGGWGLFALLADSASPSLMVLTEKGTDHVVPILGHTMNSDEWHPQGATLHVDGHHSASSSSLWTDHLVMHDDVLGPYYCLSRAAIVPGREPELRTRLALAILPDNVEVSPLQAEDFARQILFRLVKRIGDADLGEGRWWQHLVDGRERVVFRTTLIGRETYINTLEPQDEDDRFCVDDLAEILPNRFWMVEVSLPNLFCANRAKLGELLISPRGLPGNDDPEAALETLIGFRLPSVLGWASPDDTGSGRAFDASPWPETGHRPIYAPHHNPRRW